MASWLEDILTRIDRTLHKLSDKFNTWTNDHKNCCSTINQKLDDLQTAATTGDTKLNVLQTELSIFNTKLDKVLELLQSLSPGPAVSFSAQVVAGSTATFTAKGELKMTTKNLGASADLQVNDATGTFNIVLSFQDADGVSTATPAGLSATYSASDATPGPSVLDLAPSPDTASCAGAVDQANIKALISGGGALPTDITISITATWDGLASPLTVVADPAIDIVAGPAASFVAKASE